MEGEDEVSEDDRSFSKSSIPKRIAICAAGAIVNILFAIIVYFILMATSGVYISNEVDSTIPGYAAEQVGIQSGDKIIKLNGEAVNNKYDLDNIMEKANGEKIAVTIDRNGEILELTIKPTEVQSKVTGMYFDKYLQTNIFEDLVCAPMVSQSCRKHCALALSLIIRFRFAFL